MCVPSRIKMKMPSNFKASSFKFPNTYLLKYNTDRCIIMSICPAPEWPATSFYLSHNVNVISQENGSEAELWHDRWRWPSLSLLLSLTFCLPNGEHLPWKSMLGFFKSTLLHKGAKMVLDTSLDTLPHHKDNQTRVNESKTLQHIFL